MRILVTAAGRAIGRSICTTLAAAGHDVIATARNVSLLDGLDVAKALALDVTDQQSIESALREAGEVDGVVNNAALPGSGPLESFPLEHLRDMMETNVVGPLGLVQRLIPHWREQGHGVIINISSVQGRVSSPLGGAYSATKFALEAVSESLHYELGHFGVRVVVIEPGYIAPGMKKIAELPRPVIYRDLYEQWDSTDARVTGPAGRPGPELVAAAVLSALEDESTAFRVPVGDDAAMILGARAAMGDREFEEAMRAVTGLTW